MNNRLKTLNEDSESYETTFLYPFIVSEKDSDGERQHARIRTRMHGFEILTDSSMSSRFFNHADEGGVEPGTKVYEIRVKNHSGEWQDWQAIVGGIQILPPHIPQLEKSAEEIFKKHLQRFQNHFEIRYSGILWRSPYGEVTIIDDESHLIKTVNSFTLEIEYKTDLSNNCYSMKQQFKDQKKFRKKYYVFDEEGNRL